MNADPTHKPAAAPARLVSLHLRRHELMSAWLLLIVPWLLVVWLQFRWHTQQPRAKAQPNGVHALPGVQPCRSGPWGNVEYSRVTLEPPDEFVPYEFQLGDVKWLFKGMSRSQAGELLDKLGLQPEQRQKLAQAPWEDTAAGATLRPPREVVLGMAPTVRAALYSFLGEAPENATIALSFRFRTERLEEWFADSHLCTTTVALVQSLFYQVGSTTMFADSATVFPMLNNPEEVRNLYKALARKSALLVRLRIPPGSDVAGWARYWSVGGRAKDIDPLLSSLARQAGGGVIDIMHLLPRHARSRINTFPLPANQALQTPWDCHWTSLNFFRDTPNDAFGTTAGAVQEIEANYTPVIGNPKLGDLVLFFDEKGGTFHSCVYVADEIVFTKNGPSAMAPWVLMTLPDVIAAYETGHPIHLRYFRRNGT